MAFSLLSITFPSYYLLNLTSPFTFTLSLLLISVHSCNLVHFFMLFSELYHVLNWQDWLVFQCLIFHDNLNRLIDCYVMNFKLALFSSDSMVEGVYWFHITLTIVSSLNFILCLHFRISFYLLYFLLDMFIYFWLVMLLNYRLIDWEIFTFS